MTMTITDFGDRLRRGEVTSAQVTEECLERIAADTGRDRLNAFTSVQVDAARRQAETADRELARGQDRGQLHGVPISIKDIIDVRGVPTTAASRVRDGHVATRDAVVVAHLRQAGAVLIGKTNLDEFAYGTTSENSAFGAVRNPHDRSRSPGGSSGGAAVSVAAHMALAAIGTDTGGSIRIPASACGIVGVKPSLGEVSTDGVVPLAETLDHVGPLTYTVDDARIIYRALLGGATGIARDRLAAPLRPRLAVPRRYFCDLLDDEIRARFDSALVTLAAMGVQISDVDIPHAGETAATYLAIHAAEAAAFHATTFEATPDRYTSLVRQRLEMGRGILAKDHLHARANRTRLRTEVDLALGDRDALVLPTLPIPAPSLGTDTVEVSRRSEPVRALMLRLTQLFNITGHPAVSIPMGVTRAGLPCGLQLVGPRFRTDSLLACASTCEALLRPA